MPPTLCLHHSLNIWHCAHNICGVPPLKNLNTFSCSVSQPNFKHLSTLLCAVSYFDHHNTFWCAVCPPYFEHLSTFLCAVYPYPILNVWTYIYVQCPDHNINICKIFHLQYPHLNMKIWTHIWPHSALSWIMSLAEILTRFLDQNLWKPLKLNCFGALRHF